MNNIQSSPGDQQATGAQTASGQESGSISVQEAWMQQTELTFAESHGTDTPRPPSPRTQMNRAADDLLTRPDVQQSFNKIVDNFVGSGTRNIAGQMPARTAYYNINGNATYRSGILTRAFKKENPEQYIHETAEFTSTDYFKSLSHKDKLKNI